MWDMMTKINTSECDSKLKLIRIKLIPINTYLCRWDLGLSQLIFYPDLDYTGPFVE